MTINLTREDFEQAIKSGASVFEGNTILDTGKPSGRYYRFIRVPLANGEHKMEKIKKANSGRPGRLYGITLAVVEELTEEYMRKYNSPNTQEIMFRLLVELAKQYKTVRLVLNINGKTTEVKYPVKGMMNSDILYGGGFSTCNITPRSEENRIEEFIANNDSQLEDNRRIPIKYIPEVYYGNKLIWKNPNFANT